jgi:NTP pyrophosphatase (non-canonical NTP hydrolase)
MEAGKTAIYPEEGEGSPAALAYTALGLTGEAGEVANKVKKLLRDGDQPELRQAIIDELGDVLWYVAMTAHELAIPLDEVAARNLDKLQQRQQTGTIGGSVYPGAWRVQFDDDGSWLSFYSHEITALGAEADA